jgi:hypothetical protein
VSKYGMNLRQTPFWSSKNWNPLLNAEILRKYGSMMINQDIPEDLKDTTIINLLEYILLVYRICLYAAYHSIKKKQLRFFFKFNLDIHDEVQSSSNSA